MAWFIANTAGAESGRGDFSANCTIFNPLAMQSDAFLFVAEVDASAVTENACLQRDTAVRAGAARFEPLTIQLGAVGFGGFRKADRATIQAA